ncbi:MAG: hypothetical protein WDM77_16785 [Steroidobacteraceae bacterium]
MEAVADGFGRLSHGGRGIGRGASAALLNNLQPYSNEPRIAVSRPRGKSPQQCAFFTPSPQHKEESSLLASLCSLLGALPRTGTPVNRQALASLPRGELLCQAFEVYHDLVADPHISFEHLVFLVSALAAGEELILASCEDCGALTVGERISFKARRCLHCASAIEARNGAEQ